MEPALETNATPPPINTGFNPNPAPVIKKNNKLLVIVSVMLFLIVITGVFLAWQFTSNESNVIHISNQSNSSNQNNITNNQTPQPPTVIQKKIAYVKTRYPDPENRNNKGIEELWVVGSDGSNKTLADPGLSPATSASFPTVNWKDKNDLTYARCDPNCHVYTYNLTNNNSALEASPGQTDSNAQIFALTWNHAGNTLAYIYKLPDGEMKMDFKSGTDTQVVKTFAVQNAGSGGRDTTLDDNVSIYFSPDDKNVLVTNTLGQPNNIDQSTIWVFDSSGKEIINIKSDTNSWATQSEWGMNNYFIYKRGNNIYADSLTSAPDKPVLLGSLSTPYNPILADFAKSAPVVFGYYWSESNELPWISNFDFTESSKNEKKIIDGFYKPQFLDDAHLLALKAQKIPPAQESPARFMSSGISVINVNTQQTVDLDSGDINLFAVSP